MISKKNLLVFSTQLMPTGGIESHVQEFIINMTKLNRYNIDLVVLNANIPKEQKDFYKNICRSTFLPSGKSLFHKLFFVKVVARSLWHKYDALYTNGQGNSIILMRKIFRCKKWVHHHHTAGDLEDQSTWPEKYKKALLTADEVIACSKRNTEDIYSVLRREVKSIPCFSREITLNKDDAADKQYVDLGYYGRLIPEKGIDLICRLSKEEDLQHIRFHLWGEGEKYSSDYFKKFPKLNYHGVFRGNDGLKKVLETIDGYLLLSTHAEGLPISLLELNAVGIPWIATDRGGIRDILSDSINTSLLPNVENYDLIKSSVLDLANAILKGATNGYAQKKIYQERFASVVVTKKWEEVLFNG